MSDYKIRFQLDVWTTDGMKERSFVKDFFLPCLPPIGWNVIVLGREFTIEDVDGTATLNLDESHAYVCLTETDTPYPLDSEAEDDDAYIARLPADGWVEVGVSLDSEVKE